MPHNLILMKNIRNVPNIGMTMRRISNRVGGNHRDVGNLLTQNQQTAVAVPPTIRTNSTQVDLLNQIYI